MYPLAEGLFAARNQWYVAAWSKEVTRQPMERVILNEPVAFYRKEDGAAVAVEGRCPHRSFPLGRGRVVGDNLQCGYHGITFRPDGSCLEVPSQDHIPKACRIRAFPLAERWKWLWIWMGDPALADESLIPDHVEIGLTDPAFKNAGDSYKLVPGRYMLVHDNLLDLTHIGHLHRETFGDGADSSEVPTVEMTDRWIESRFVQHIPCPPFLSAMLNYQGPVVRRFGLRLYMPCLHAGGDTLHAVNADGSEGDYLGALRVYHAVTPATHHTTHYFYGLGHSWDNEDPAYAAKMIEGLRPALEEDFNATRYIEEMVQRAGGRPSELLLKADNVCVQGRRFFERTIRAEQPPAPPASVPVPVSVPVATLHTDAS